MPHDSRSDLPRSILVGLFLLGLAALPAAGAASYAAASIVGQSGAGSLTVDGITVPTGTTLLSPSEIETGGEPALVHLANGRLVALGADSRARLTAEAGQLRLVVTAGRAAVRQASEVAVLEASQSITLPLGAAALEETPTGSAGETVELCTYDTEADAWMLVTVPASAVDDRLAAGDVYPGKANNDLGLDDECDYDKVVGWTKGSKVAAAFGAAALVGAVIVEDDDSSEASP